MTDLESIYQNLTSVNLDEQLQLWNERGKGYYGEFLVLKSLYTSIIGQSKILMNLIIPTPNGKSTEIDLLMIHESGIYVFEVKHYKGTIYGNKDDEVWTQYFRTQKNSHFHNPIKQNEYHIAALKQMFPDLPIYSIIVFTNNETRIKIAKLDDSKTIVCRIDELPIYVNRINQSDVRIINFEQIENIFNQLSEYSPIGQQEIISTDEKPVSFERYINIIKDDYNSELKKIQETERKKYKQKLFSVISVAGIICTVILIITLGTVVGFKTDSENARKAQEIAEKKLSVFSQKFNQVDNYHDGNVELVDDFFQIIDYDIKQSKDLKNTIVFSCKIQVNGEKYGIRFHPNSRIIVKLKNGTVYEYSCGNIGLSYTIIASFAPNWYNNKNKTDLPQIMISAQDVDDIAFIKLSNIFICTKDNKQENAIPNVEFELYSSQ